MTKRIDPTGRFALPLALLVSSGVLFGIVDPLPAQEERPADEAEQDEDPPLPKLEELELPSVEELVKGPPVDWIILDNADQEVIVANPVYPRPRPLEQLQAKIDKLTERAGKTPAERERIREQVEKLQKLAVTLPGDEANEYELPTEKIAEVRHHEDLLLRRVGRLLDEGEFRQAFELLFPLARQHPDWPGLAEMENRLLFEQAEERLDAGRHEEALVLLEELFERNANHPRLKERLVSAAGTLIENAVAGEDFRRARHFLGRLRQRLPQDEVVGKWSDDLLARARDFADRTREAREAGRHDEAARLVREAAVRWPDTPGLRELHRLATSRWQRLRVGVRELPGDALPVRVSTAADERHRRLTKTALFQVAGIDRRPIHRHPHVESWEPTELGRTMELRLRHRREDWESLEPLTAHVLSRSLARRLDPADDAHDERLASLVKSITVRSPFRLDVRFDRAPLSPESLLSEPLPPIPATSASESDAAATGGRFVVHERDANATTYRRAVPEPDGLDPTEYHVAEIVERRYGNWDAAAQALLRGDVDVLPHVRPKDVDRLVGSGRFFVRRHALPETHLLQFNPASEPLRSRQLRRSLGHAIDRRTILAETFLGSLASPHGRITTGPAATSTVFYNSSVEPRPYDLVVAIALRLVAQKELGGPVPELTLLVVGDELAEAAAGEIVEDWKQAGISARIRTPEDLAADESASWDVLYRRVRLGDPLVETWPLLTLSDTARVADLEPLPDWLRKDLVALDRVATWGEAEQKLRQLHADLHDDARLLPLWELDDHYVVRDTLRLPGTADVRRIHLYEDVERWIVRDVYPEIEP